MGLADGAAWEKENKFWISQAKHLKIYPNKLEFTNKIYI